MQQEKEWKVDVIYDNDEVTYQDSKYIIQEAKGNGTSAIVYKAKKILKGGPEQFVALRIQRRYYLDDFLQLERLKELQFINTTYPRQNYPGRAGLFTEYELFDDNITNIPERNINENTMLLLIRTIGQALEAIHNKQYIHCDVKPDNIVYRIDGDKINFALCDFSSIIKLEKLNEPKFIQMTPIFAAPEINLQGKTVIKDEKQDIWSLGVTFYNLYQKKQLISEENLKQRNNQAFINEQVNEIQSTKIKAIVERCLIVDQNQRASSKDILQMLNQFSKNQINESDQKLIDITAVDSSQINKSNGFDNLNNQSLNNYQKNEQTTQFQQSIINDQIISEHNNLIQAQQQLLTQKDSTQENLQIYEVSQATECYIQVDLAPWYTIEQMLQFSEDRCKIKIHENNQLASCDFSRLI